MEDSVRIDVCRVLPLLFGRIRYLLQPLHWMVAGQLIKLRQPADAIASSPLVTPISPVA